MASPSTSVSSSASVTKPTVSPFSSYTIKSDKGEVLTYPIPINEHDKQELISLCQDFGLQTTGNKTDLIKRLNDLILSRNNVSSSPSAPSMVDLLSEGVATSPPTEQKAKAPAETKSAAEIDLRELILQVLALAPHASSASSSSASPSSSLALSLQQPLPQPQLQQTMPVLPSSVPSAGANLSALKVKVGLQPSPVLGLQPVPAVPTPALGVADDEEEKTVDLVGHRITAECRVQTKGDASGWVNQQHFKNNRNQRECVALAAIIDALNNEDVGTALEIAYRRLTGVHLSDMHNNWHLASQVEWPYGSSTTVSLSTLNSITRAASSFARLQTKASGTSRSFSSSNYKPNKNNKKNFRPSHSKSGVGSTQAGASRD